MKGLLRARRAGQQVKPPGSHSTTTVQEATPPTTVQEGRKPGLHCWNLVMWPWTSHFPSLGFGLFICIWGATEPDDIKKKKKEPSARLAELGKLPMSLLLKVGISFLRDEEAHWENHFQMSWAPIQHLDLCLDLDRILEMFSVCLCSPFTHPFFFLKTRWQLKAPGRSSLTAPLFQLGIMGQECKGGQKNLHTFNLATGRMWQSLKGMSRMWA